MFTLPRCVDCMGDNIPQFFPFLDCTQGFHQILLDQASRDKSAFIIPSDKNQYKTMPQGICSCNCCPVSRSCTASSTNTLWPILMIFAVFHQCLKNTLNTSVRFSPAFKMPNSNFIPLKHSFAVQKVTYHGHVLRPEGITPQYR